jgi:hypothetical protein
MTRYSIEFKEAAVQKMMTPNAVPGREVRRETGSMEAFEAARNLYLKYGFVECDPFAEYDPDRNSVFMTRSLVSRYSSSSF